MPEDKTVETMIDQLEWKPMEKTINENCKEAFKKLEKILQNTECSKKTRLMHYEQKVQNCIREQLDNIVAEAQSKKLLLKTIEDWKKRDCVSLALFSFPNSSAAFYALVPKTYDQIPLNEVEQMLQADLQNLERMKERMMLLKELLAKEHNICEKLGIKIELNIDVLLSEQELESFKLYLQKQENEKIHLQNVFTEIRHSIIKMMNDLDIVASSSFEQLICDNPEEFVLNANNMAKLREFRDKLKTQVEETKCEIEKMKELLTLWKYLDKPADIYQSFLDRYPGYGTNLLKNYL
nr:PREDICTED: LOW QUALITY PROTEIN: uncharacterized protein LOC105674109 [Linepithema humile]